MTVGFLLANGAAFHGQSLGRWALAAISWAILGNGGTLAINSVYDRDDGDIGYLDAEGYLYLTDRQSNMIISGGVNIYPQETESHLVTHPKVYDVAVIGVPDEEMGEAVKAVVVPAPGCAPGPALADELIEYCRAHIAHYKCPRTIDFVEELPRTETGKMQKRKLRDRYWQGHAGRLV